MENNPGLGYPAVVRLCLTQTRTGICLLCDLKFNTVPVWITRGSHVSKIKVFTTRIVSFANASLDINFSDTFSNLLRLTRVNKC